jgi:phosphatidylethanolamine-binding protein (PEBP) family uncharacterized protein
MNQFVTRSALSFAAVAPFAAAGYGQVQSAGDDASVLAYEIAALHIAAAPLMVTSSSFPSGGKLDAKFTQDGDNMSPSLSWSEGPLGAQSYVVLSEGIDVVDGHRVVRSVIYNVPFTTTGLPQSVPADAQVENGALTDAMQAKLRGSASDAGPTSPFHPSGKTRWRHFEVFALSTRLNLDPALPDLQGVVSAMKNLVVTSGDIAVS